MLQRNRVVQPLSEALEEIGLDPEKTLGDLGRTNELIDKRMNGAHGGGAPSYLRPAAREISEDADPADPAAAPAADGDPTETVVEGVSLEEALRSVKRKRLSGSEKAAGRRSRRKNKGKRRAAGKMYARRNKRRISKLAKKKRKKFGGTAGLEKLHRGGRRIEMSADSPLANLREDLNAQAVASVTEDESPYYEAAVEAGTLALYLGEMFEAFGDEQSAETMYDVSDAAADIAEGFEGLDELDEGQEDSLSRVIDPLVKGLRIYEAMGSPSLGDIIEMKMKDGYGGKPKTKDDGDDDGDDDDDE